LYVNAGCVDTLVDAIQRVASSPAPRKFILQ